MCSGAVIILEEVVLGQRSYLSWMNMLFQECTGLKQITIPENVQSIDATGICRMYEPYGIILYSRDRR